MTVREGHAGGGVGKCGGQSDNEKGEAGVYIKRISYGSSDKGDSKHDTRDYEGLRVA